MKRLLIKVIITFLKRLQNNPFETFKSDPPLQNTGNLVQNLYNLLLKVNVAPSLAYMTEKKRSSSPCLPKI